MTQPEAMARYQELLDIYLDAPQKGNYATGLADDLELMERVILDTPPLGKGKGLLEHTPMRDSGSGNLRDVLQAPSLSEVFKTIHERYWDEKIEEQDSARLRPFVWDILNQANVGSCASEGISGCIMCRRDIKNAPRIKLNPWFAYGRVNGGSDQGSTLEDNISFAQRYGIASQDAWPRDKGWRTNPTEAAYENALRHRVLDVARIRNKEEFGSALIYGLPVYFGYSGHAIFACDPIDRLRFRYANSWNESWGDGGFGTLSYDSIYWGYGVHAILSVTTPS